MKRLRFGKVDGEGKWTADFFERQMRHDVIGEEDNAERLHVSLSFVIVKTLIGMEAEPATNPLDVVALTRLPPQMTGIQGMWADGDWFGDWWKIASGSRHFQLQRVASGVCDFNNFRVAFIDNWHSVHR